jgi:outer membrane protein assembly factor BamC
VLQEDKVDYKSAGSAPTLEVPPDLTKLSTETRYTVPGGSVTASGMARTAQATPSASVALVTVGDVRIEKLANQRWLVVNRTPEQLWGPVRDFWQENGFLLTVDQPAVGIMETDWAENRAKIPQDIIRASIGKVIDGAYSTAERDKFRTRMERLPTGGTEIFISHRGHDRGLQQQQQGRHGLAAEGRRPGARGRISAQDDDQAGCHGRAGEGAGGQQRRGQTRRHADHRQQHAGGAGVRQL